MSQPWTWDAARGSYCRWLAQEQCYLYQDGTKVPAAQPQTYQQSQTANSPVPRTHAGQVGADVWGYNQQPQPQQWNVSYTGTNQTQPGSSSAGIGGGVDELSRQFGSMDVTPSSPQMQSYYTHVQPQQAPAPSHPQPSSLQTWPQEEILDKDLLKKGARARGKIKATKGKVEELDGNFYVRDHPRRFFVVGKVIKILWPELPGNTTEGMTVVSDAKYEKEKFVSKIRWFVVVKESRESCTCVPISTYGGRGCGKTGLAKWQHCIVYTGRDEPDLLAGEAPGREEQGMLSSIRVKPRQRGDAMFLASRINFSKLYTVEHNVKVYDFGNVHPDFLPQLKASWNYVLQADLQGNPAPTPDPTPPVQPIAGPLVTIKEGEPTTNLGDPPIHGTANSAWDGATLEGQLLFQKDERIYVVEHVDQAWSRGRNESTRLEGLFPRGLVTLDYPDYGTALCDREYDRRRPDYLAFEEDDRILLLHYVNANLDMGRNTRTGKEGKYPYDMVKMDRGVGWAIAKRDYVPDENNPSRLRYTAKDRILVTYFADIASPAWGRNERTRREGRFPGSHMKFVTQ